MKPSHRFALSLVAAVALLAGCFETRLNLGSDKNAKVDPAYCGEWTFSWKDDDGSSKNGTATVLNFDGVHYFVEWKEEGEKTVRYNGFVVPVKDAQFAQLSPLGSDLSQTHLIVRIKLDGTKLAVRHLKKEFFDGVSSDEALKKKVEENLNTDAMYEGPWVAGALTNQP